MINRRVAAQIMLASLDFSEGRRKEAAQRLQMATEDPDYAETLESLNDVVEEESDPFLQTSSDDELDFDLDIGNDDAEEEEEEEAEDDAEEARVVRASLPLSARQRRIANEEKTGGNNGPEGADRDNDSDEEIRQVSRENTEAARMRIVRANLVLLSGNKSKPAKPAKRAK